MEREKLEEAKKTFEEDQDKFKKYMTDLNDKTEKTTEEVKRLINDKAQKIQEIANIEMQIQEIKSEAKKIEESLTLYKQHKKFLDVLAISAGKKKAQKQVSKGDSSKIAFSPDKGK